VAGRKPLIAVGMLVQAGALALLVAGGGAFTPALAAAALLGLGTALVYPTLLAAVSDVVQPRDRVAVVGVYRFWRDSGFVAGALLAGFVADALGSGQAIAVVAALTGLSGLLVAATRWEPHGARLRQRRWPPSPNSSRPMPLALLRSGPNRPAKGGTMRAIECPCGHHVEGDDDDELFRPARRHVDSDHPEMPRTDA
jgi:MFS family permease